MINDDILCIELFSTRGRFIVSPVGWYQRLDAVLYLYYSDVNVQVSGKVNHKQARLRV